MSLLLICLIYNGYFILLVRLLLLLLIYNNLTLMPHVVLRTYFGTNDLRTSQNLQILLALVEGTEIFVFTVHTFVDSVIVCYFSHIKYRD